METKEHPYIFYDELRTIFSEFFRREIEYKGYIFKGVLLSLAYERMGKKDWHYKISISYNNKIKLDKVYGYGHPLRKQTWWIGVEVINFLKEFNLSVTNREIAILIKDLERNI